MKEDLKVTDNLKETVSAFVDGEVSEIEVHRVLRHLRKTGNQDENTKLTSSYIIYQQIRTVIRRGAILSSQSHQTLHQRISEAISRESAAHETSSTPGLKHSATAGLKSSAFSKPAAGLAIAASLVVALVIGVQLETGKNQGSGISGMPKGQVSNTLEPVRPQYVTSGPGVREDELVELDEEKQKLVREYLLRHDRMTRLKPDVKIVNFENQ